MTKKTKPVKQKKQPQPELAKPWITMRNGLIIITIASLALTGLIAWQVVPQRGWLEGILWGLMFGGFVWAIFLVNLLVNKALRRGR